MKCKIVLSFLLHYKTGVTCILKFRLKEKVHHKILLTYACDQEQAMTLPKLPVSCLVAT